MRSKFLLVTAALLCSTPSFAQGFLHGRDLYSFCAIADETLETAGKATCVAFIIGAVDAFTRTHDICLSKDVIGKQVTDIVIDYLRNHPQTRNYTAASEIDEALKRFHCSNSSKWSLIRKRKYRRANLARTVAINPEFGEGKLRW
jgi:hypothetical protein